MTIFIISILSSFVFGSSFCDGDLKPNDHYQDTTALVKASGSILANSPAIATSADKVLSSLLSKNSPLVINWIKRNKLNPLKDEAMIVKKWREYFLETYILRKYPTGDIKVDNLIEDSFNKISKKAFRKKDVDRFNSLFDIAKNNSLSYLKAKLGKEKALIARVKEVELYWYEELKNSKYEKMPLEFLQWGLAYDPVPNEINIGIRALSYNSDEEIVASLIHEIAHSFDPCRWDVFIKGTNNFSKVLTCLRSDESVGAKFRDDSFIDEYVKKGKMTKNFAKVLRMNKTCNKSFYPPPTKQRDQIAEVFADWFSAEVIAFNSKKFINKKLRRDLCLSSKLSQGSSYISNKNRLERIYFANPVIAKKIGVSSPAKYCSL